MRTQLTHGGCVEVPWCALGVPFPSLLQSMGGARFQNLLRNSSEGALGDCRVIVEGSHLGLKGVFRSFESQPWALS